MGHLLLVALLAFVLSACSKEGDADPVDTGTAPTITVLVVHSVRNTLRDDVLDKLTAFGFFATIDAFDARDATPDLVELQEHDAVLVMSDNDFDDADALGNVLADHVDAGGGVVLAMFSVSSAGADTPGGRFASGNYYAISQADSNGADDGPHGMTIQAPGHPILDGVGTFSGGSRSFRPEGSTVTGTTVATWDDGADTPLVGVREIAGVRRADLGFFPPTSDAGLAFLTDPSTDALRILANALRWVAGEI